MNVRYIKNNSITGFSSRFNMHGFSEVIVQFSDGDATSELIEELEVQLKNGSWYKMSDAFYNNLIINDNYNTRFFEPRTLDDRKRGYTL